MAKVRSVGAALGKNERAEALASDIDQKLKAAEAATTSITERKRVVFILSMQGGKVLAAGKDSAADGIIRLAGAVNAIEGFSGYKQLSDEAAIARPDVILMMGRADGPGIPDDELFLHPAKRRH